ncbi:Uncharacterized protein TCM_007050 [Theobroma cacao]|uniref:DUF4283 domain-containing protein n=1 Tax=Theobroma cacao TaxID=3641 RepID=A0A061E7M5_THECC|nr:Uncharacterized protein TCM_007050 [Theobroma cacao]
MPRLTDIRKSFVGLGLSGAYNVRWMNYKHILINLSNEQDFNRIWRKQTWFIANQKMRVFKWTPDFETEKESSIVPVWISFPNLKAHLFEKSALLLIAKAIGYPLYVDEATANGTRPSVARVCIEYDCLKAPLDSVWIVVSKRGLEDMSGGYLQKYWDRKVGRSAPKKGDSNRRELSNQSKKNKQPDETLGTKEGEKPRTAREGEKELKRAEQSKQKKQWQVVGKVGSSGAKKTMENEDEPGFDVRHAGVPTSNKFQVIMEEDIEEQNRASKQGQIEVNNAHASEINFSAKSGVATKRREGAVVKIHGDVMDGRSSRQKEMANFHRTGKRKRSSRQGQKACT